MKNLFTKLLLAGLIGIGYFSNAQISCNNNLYASLSDDGLVKLYPEHVLEGNPTGNFEISLDDILYEPFIFLDCGNLGDNPVYVRNTANGNTCWSTVMVEDKLKPTPYAISLSTAISDPITCSVELWAIDFNIGSFDNCDIVAYTFGTNGYFPADTIINDTLLDMSVDHYFNAQGQIVADGTPNQTILTQFAQGILQKWDASIKSSSKMFFPGASQQTQMSVTDNSGLSDYAQVIANITSCNGGNPGCVVSQTLSLDVWGGDRVINAHEFVFGMNNNDSVDVSFDQVNYFKSFVYGCDDVVSNETIYVRYTYNGEVENCQAVFDFWDLTSPVAIARQQISLQLPDANSSVSITVDDIDNGSYDNCALASRVLSQYTFDINDLGVNDVYLTLHDVHGNVGQITSQVVISVEGLCGITENDITWPDPKLELSDPSLDPTMLSPSVLIANHNFAQHQVEPTFLMPCQNVVMSYTDQVINIPVGNQNYFKIIRDWTVLDWSTGMVFQHTHLISNTPTSDLFICDFLPRIAPVGDCTSGHTLADDVEWPNDILVDDYRIGPADLVSISNVEPEDAEPNFYNEPNQYTSSYEDILINLSATEIELGRRWTVTRTDNGFSWNYTQLLAIDISGFGNLVTVSDPVGRAVPGVVINGSLTTDDRGRAQVSENVSDLFKTDESKNGLTIRDMYMMQQNILDIENLDKVGELAGDINQANDMTSADIINMAKILLDISYLEEHKHLRFVENTNDIEGNAKPKASYIAYKPGDVDHTYSTGENYFFIENAIAVKDQLLNAGETYQIPVFLNANINLEAVHLNIGFDSELITVNDVITNRLPDSPSSNIGSDAFKSIMLFSNPANLPVEGEAFFLVDITVRENSLVSQIFDFDSAVQEILANGKQLYTTSVEVQNQIPTPVVDIEGDLITLNAYPNPAIDMVYFSLSKDLDIDKITIFNLMGERVQQIQNASVIDVSALHSGMYFYQVEIKGTTLSGKLKVID